MDLIKAIRDLHEEKRRLDKTIGYLERLVAEGPKPPAARSSPRNSRRGRKSMSEDERRQVSERMARYWAQRRARAAQAPAAASADGSSDPTS